MNYQMDPKETYLYGILFVLVKDQLAAKEKQMAGNLGMWGKSRLNSRNKEIEKIIFHLFDKKNSLGEEILPEVLADLEYIETEPNRWAEVTAEELEYLREILPQLA